MLLPRWFSANLAFNASLCVDCGTGTSVASNTGHVPMCDPAARPQQSRPHV